LNRRLTFSLGLVLLAILGMRSAAQDSGSTQQSDTSINSSASVAQDPSAKTSSTAPNSMPSGIDSPQPKTDPYSQNTPQQTTRILGIIPNYRAVSANTQLPPLGVKEKFWLATQDTFDYSNFIFVGMLSGIAMAGKSEPAFAQGAAGYGRYYWHTFVDVGVGNYMTESIVPTLTKEDPRYYTLGHGGVIKRTGYAVSRLFITRTDAGKNTFNFSEIIGNGAAAGIANTYYPSNVNTFVKTYQRWGWQIGYDGIANIFKEYWPEINHSIFHEKY
jgi:hypothetical protein